MDLKNISNHELIQRLEKLVRTERKITHLVLLHIAEIEERKIYAEMGYDGMYPYLTRGLGYSDGSAYRRLQSARLLKQIPSVAEKLESGALNLSQLTQVQKSVQSTPSQDVTKTVEILSKLENKNSFETQKVLAVALGIPVQTHEKLKPQADDSVRIELTLTQEQFQELEKARNLLSHVCPGGSFAEVIGTLARQFNQKKLIGKGSINNLNDDSKKQNNNNNNNNNNNTKGDKTTKLTQPVVATGLSSPEKSSLLKNVAKPPNGGPIKRKYISLHTRREIFKKAQHCCEYNHPKTKTKCSSKYFLEIDHIQPLALGGNDKPTNLRVLCRTHNVEAARRLGLSR